MSEKVNPISGQLGTRVDLGDDLIVKTAVLDPALQNRVVHPILESFKMGSITRETIPEVLASVKILMSENFYDDAKRLLHQVLLVDPDQAIATHYLAEVHDQELKQLFGDDSARSPTFLFQNEKQKAPFTGDPDQIIRKLDEDLNLGLFVEAAGARTGQPLSLFEDQGELEKFCDRLEKTLQHDKPPASPQDWIDLGIGFLEMELYLVAIRLFTGAIKQAAGVENSEIRVSGTCLLALALASSQKYYEAIAEIQPLLLDVDLQQQDKLELFYLMGRTYEMMRKPLLSLPFYQQITEVESSYRDTVQRLRSCTLRSSEGVK